MGNGKSKGAGEKGETEVRRAEKRRLDVAAKRRAIEVERSGSLEDLKKAALRLKASKKPRKVLQVPQAHMGKAVEAMRAVGIGGTVKNLSGTKRRLVRSSLPTSMIKWVL